MAIVTVELDEDDIQDACKYWATRRVLNEGVAVSCNLEVVVCNGTPTGTINKVTVGVETAAIAARQEAPEAAAIRGEGK